MLPMPQRYIPGFESIPLSSPRSFELHKEDLAMTVGPGLHKEELNALLEPHGFLLGPDPASNPSIGGMCSPECLYSN